ncbi:MAG: baseplate J/gp47 family protein [Acinetobacter sp.]|nr:baseplate J/gp47 family protein [Acinetobacter sp.]
MRTKVLSTSELSKVAAEAILNNTNRVSKVAPESVLVGVSNGVGRLGQSAMKDIALIEARLFPDDAHGDLLDEVALNNGISARFGAVGSSMYLRLVGTPGTVYTQSTHTFTGNHGIVFELEQNETIPSIGWMYVKVRSIDTGAKTSVAPLTVNKINTTPSGHTYVINEYQAQGGRDAESDTDFRERIKNGANIAAYGTVEYLNQVFQKVNSAVLRTYFAGINSLQQPIVRVITRNGTALLQSEIDTLIEASQKYLGLVEQRVYGDRTFGINITNVDWYPIDVDFRADLSAGINVDNLRKQIQVNLAKTIDYRTWEWGDKVEWDNLLQVVKSTPGVKYVADAYFLPKTDITVQRDRFPRFRGFTMRDLNGNILTDIQGNLNPVYYPSSPNSAFQQTVISTI